MSPAFGGYVLVQRKRQGKKAQRQLSSCSALACFCADKRFCLLFAQVRKKIQADLSDCEPQEFRIDFWLMLVRLCTI
jgi:hypothetical protein